MTDVNDTQKENTGSHAQQVNIKMQYGEHTNQPVYSNFTAVQAGQGVVIVDFGFLDPQTINIFNRMIKLDEKIPGAISAKMSCRMAISIDAANQLAQQLNQLLNRKSKSPIPMKQQNAIDQTKEKTPSDNHRLNEKSSAPENSQGGFQFPWSRK